MGEYPPFLGSRWHGQWNRRYSKCGSSSNTRNLNQDSTGRGASLESWCRRAEAGGPLAEKSEEKIGSEGGREKAGQIPEYGVRGEENSGRNGLFVKGFGDNFESEGHGYITRIRKNVCTPNMALRGKARQREKKKWNAVKMPEQGT
ncbi:hypothetical protein VNO77_27480 [Canavalia gladiata]|uniref:Uncharacterized protein n=1 Tax=Canavalia gladiata TaxID=3824 RepID=A0AAN9Q6J1_CANGL